MKIDKMIIMLSVTFVFYSCQNDDGSDASTTSLGISSDVLNTSVFYEQTIFNGGANGNINVFNSTDNTIYLQSYRNGSDETDGYWSIPMTNVDLNNIALPYTLQGSEGAVSWVDNTVKSFQQSCSDPATLCFYNGTTERDEVEIRIIKIENNIIEGTFSGRIYHITINPTVIRDTNDYVDIENGIFSVRFQSN